MLGDFYMERHNKSYPQQFIENAGNFNPKIFMKNVRNILQYLKDSKQTLIVNKTEP